jgi:SsrA-binding protein
MNKKNSDHKIISQNKKAFFEYFIEETYQVGIELKGTEVKSIRHGLCNLKDSYVLISDEQVYIEGMHVSPYKHGNIFNLDPTRKRRLLLHRYEINKLIGAVKIKGYTLVPLKIYFMRNFIKLDIALAKGKKLHDKRHDIAKKDIQREVERSFKINHL